MSDFSLAQQHSKPGHGSTVRGFSPAACGSADPASAPSPAAESSAGPGPVSPKNTILIVDDEAPLREMAQRMITRFGFRPLMAASGQEALSLYPAHASEIACVLLDLTMPGMDGMQTLDGLQRVNPHVRVILMSGYSEKEALPAARRHHVAGFIQKPYEMGTLSAKLKEVCGAPASRSAVL